MGDNIMSTTTKKATSPQVTVLLEALTKVQDQDKVPPTLAEKIAGNLRQEYHDFHSGEPLPKGSENWRETRSARLLYSDTVKIDAAYRKRAERYVHDAVHFYFMCDQYAAYLKRKAAENEAKAHA
jgi:hypothetical protein